MRRTLLATGTSLALLFSGGSDIAGQDINENEYVRLGLKVRPAFQCAVTAKRAGLQEEYDRLFQLGYDAGRRYLEALRGGEIEESAILSATAQTQIPRAGPSPDFILGRVYEEVERQVKGDLLIGETMVPPLLKDTDNINERLRNLPNLPPEEVRSDAQRRYDSMNCSLID